MVESDRAEPQEDFFTHPATDAALRKKGSGLSCDSDPCPDPADEEDMQQWAVRRAAKQPRKTEGGQPPDGVDRDVFASLLRSSRVRPRPEAVAAAKRLHAAVERHRTHLQDREVPQNLSVKNSAQELEWLTRKGLRGGSDGIPVAEWLPVLEWLCRNLSDEYTPHVFSGSGFRSKYLKLVAAMRRAEPCSSAAVQLLNDEERETLAAVESYSWPPTARRLLPDAIRLSWKNYRRIMQAMKSLPDVERVIIPGTDKVVVRRWGAWRSFVMAKASIHPTTWWDGIGRNIYHKWQGKNLLELALSIDHDALATYWLGPLTQLTGKSRSVHVFLRRLSEVMRS